MLIYDPQHTLAWLHVQAVVLAAPLVEIHNPNIAPFDGDCRIVAANLVLTRCQALHSNPKMATIIIRVCTLMLPVGETRQNSRHPVCGYIHRRFGHGSPRRRALVYNCRAHRVSRIPHSHAKFQFERERLHVMAPRNNPDDDHAVHVQPCWRGASTFNLDDNL